VQAAEPCAERALFAPLAPRARRRQLSAGRCAAGAARRRGRQPLTRVRLRQFGAHVRPRGAWRGRLRRAQQQHSSSRAAVEGCVRLRDACVVCVRALQLFLFAPCGRSAHSAL
jgi:hypothetical protein